MTTNMPLSDATIEAALARCAERISGDGLHDEIMAGVARTSQSRPLLAARLGWLPSPAPSLPLVWVVVIAGLLLALLGGSLFVGSRFMESQPRRLVDSLPRHPAVLVPTGVDMPALESSTFGGAAADATGAVWASIGGAIIRLDPASGAVRAWTVADDAAFGSISWLVPARGAGVWLVPPAESADQVLRWFDGVRFRDVVPAPPGGIPLGWGGVSLVEASDGALWSVASTGLVRWDGTAWSAAPEGRPTAGVSALAVDRSGAVWVGNADCNSVPCSERGISRHDGTRWETFTDVGVGVVMMIRGAPDGSIWVSSGEDTARYDGHAWTRPGGDLPKRLEGWGRVTWADDGTVWVTECVYFQGEVLLERYDGTAWVVYTAADGLPRSTNCGQVFATAHGVHVATGDGLYRLVGERWELAWPSASVHP